MISLWIRSSGASSQLELTTRRPSLSYDFTVRAYSALGAVQWTRISNAPLEDVGEAIALAGDRVVAVGHRDTSVKPLERDWVISAYQGMAREPAGEGGQCPAPPTKRTQSPPRPITRVCMLRARSGMPMIGAWMPMPRSVTSEELFADEGSAKDATDLPGRGHKRSRSALIRERSRNKPVVL